jgi:GntR family transcriptional regulator / MocR family aminotransferase
MVTFEAVTLNPESSVPLYRQLYDEIRRAILTGRLSVGTRLPSTRQLADQLAVSRNTVVNAFEQLLAEGYIESRTGDGTYVARTLPDDLLGAGENRRQSSPVTVQGRRLSKRGESILSNHWVKPLPFGESSPLPFRSGTPTMETFPFDIWHRLEARHWRYPDYGLLTYGESAGYMPLRRAVADYLRGARAVQCTPEQILIVSGAQQAFDLAGRVLLDPGDTMWIENPCYSSARQAFMNTGARMVSVPVDEEGLNVAAGIARSQHLSPARMVYVTPSHQHPLGVTMTLTRRLTLLEWANSVGAWILEDDYDSEYRYASRPLAALQGLDQQHRVIYVGTFSKVLFPSLRLGYMVVPPDLIEAFTAARTLTDRHSPLRDQAVLADFIAEGHFARHIRRTRIVYAERQQTLVRVTREIAGDLIEMRQADTGMHIIGWLPPGVEDRAVSRAAAQCGVEAVPISAYWSDPDPLPRGGLILGYAALDESAMRRGMRVLADVMRR